jgi:hypothetical protein
VDLINGGPELRGIAFALFDRAADVGRDGWVRQRVRDPQPRIAIGPMSLRNAALA